MAWGWANELLGLAELRSARSAYRAVPGMLKTASHFLDASVTGGGLSAAERNIRMSAIRKAGWRNAHRDAGAVLKNWAWGPNTTFAQKSARIGSAAALSYGVIRQGRRMGRGY